MNEREVYKQLKQMAINEAIAGSGKESIARNVGVQIDKIIDLALTLSANRDGYKLVPVEPTIEMINAARETHEGEPILPYSFYKAMIGAVDDH